MFEKDSKLLKHLDFMIIDLLCMYGSYFLAYIIRDGLPVEFDSMLVRVSLLGYLIINLLVSVLASSYKNIIKRGYLQELRATIVHVLLITLLITMLFFVFKISGQQSRTIIVLTAVFYIISSWIFRCIHKRRLRKTKLRNKKALLLVTTKDRLERVMSDFEDEHQIRYAIRAIVLVDSAPNPKFYKGIPIETNLINAHHFSQGKWVDSVLVTPGCSSYLPDDFAEGFLEMSIPVHHALFHKQLVYDWDNSVGKVGNYVVLTESTKIVGLSQMAAKRLLDILGGLVGSIITCILYLFLAPRIKKASPGPAFFKQKRIGRNGKPFYMYKFRTMVPNADAMKQKYMEENRISSGLMFKLDFDPRVIGNEILPDGSRKTGIGDYMRRTSLDEFPQFFNVLKGDMSLVGTRPPTPDEWKKYKMFHRARMAIKPGITGLWQVNGRSDVTDFDEIVRLDKEYINTANFWLDIKILWKTIGVVVKRRGSL